MHLLYQEDLSIALSATVGFDRLHDKTVFITGANGLVGSFLIDLFFYANRVIDANITVVANSRNPENLKVKFPNYISDSHFKTYIGDINQPINCTESVDYIINCASNTHPLQYATQPIATLLTNITGASNLLDFATGQNATLLYTSSVEIYGEDTQDASPFSEDEMGYIDCNSVRACYNEGKRAGEALCQAYISEKETNVRIVRLPRLYGSTIKKDDSKALSQFINCAISGQDIVLKSKGEQYFSYLYVADAISGLLSIMLSGKNGEAYNLGNTASDIRLKDLAQLIANKAGVKVVYDLPSETEQKGFSKATDARLNYDKITQKLGWQPKYSIDEGIRRTLEILKNAR